MQTLTTSHAPSFARLPVGRVLEGIERWVERHRQRRALLALDDSLLKDIGLSAADAWQEGSKPFWRG